MIPAEIMEFLSQEATVAVAATRDGSRIPHIRRVSGWRADPDGRMIECFIPAAFSEGLTACLEDNGEFALTLEQIGTLKTYQLKGTYVSSRPVDDADLTSTELVRTRYAQSLSQVFGLEEAVCGAYIMPPSVVVRFAVREIFLQTPGPDAGRRVVPEALQ